MLKKIIICSFGIIICGCSSLSFQADRKSQFIDINSNKILVEYGKEQHTETLPNGAELKFDRKVRITLYNGKKITLYQTLSTQGVRFQTPDKKFIFAEKGSYCRISENNHIIYEGMFNKNLTKKK